MGKKKSTYRGKPTQRSIILKLLTEMPRTTEELKQLLGAKNNRLASNIFKMLDTGQVAKIDNLWLCAEENDTRKDFWDTLTTLLESKECSFKDLCKAFSLDAIRMKAELSYYMDKYDIALQDIIYKDRPKEDKVILEYGLPVHCKKYRGLTLTYIAKHPTSIKHILSLPTGEVITAYTDEIY